MRREGGGYKEGRRLWVGVSLKLGKLSGIEVLAKAEKKGRKERKK